MRHFLVIVRAIFLEGVGISGLRPQYAALLAIATAALGFAVARFRRTIA